MMSHAVIDINDRGDGLVAVTDFGTLPIADPPRFASDAVSTSVCPAVMTVTASVVGAAARLGGFWHDGAHVAVSADGVLRAASVDGVWVWDLLPARFADGEGPENIYVAVWRD